jgi:hypothetical protein
MNSSISAIGGTASPEAMSGASSYGSPTTKMNNLFSQIDTAGSGSISQTQFNQAFQTMSPPIVFQRAGASAVFSQLDPNGTGSVSQQNFVAGMTNLMSTLRGGEPTTGAPAPSPAQTIDSSLQSLNQLGGSSDSPDGVGGRINLLA